MIKFLIKSLIGVLMIPAAIGATVSFYDNMLLVKDLSANMRFFIWGVVSYVILHIFFYKPTYVYVFGHEAVHAVTSWIFGGKIKSFKVSEEGGKVATDKTNFIVDLSPYFIPLYAIIILSVYFVVSASYRISSATFMFLIGLALAFHLISTVEILKIKQPDMMRSGYIFSIVLVYILNVIIISLVFSAMFAEFEIARYFKDLYASSMAIYRAIIKQMFF
jgi:hypothetical protein